jgi:hypothetical protein
MSAAMAVSRLASSHLNHRKVGGATGIPTTEGSVVAVRGALATSLETTVREPA